MMGLGWLTIKLRRIPGNTRQPHVPSLRSTFMYSSGSRQHPVSLAIVGDPSLSLSYLNACKRMALTVIGASFTNACMHNIQ